ncbi:MAG: radical SAM protein [Lachnospiraceae bacterium]|nr:radical SAM protein [Lachnospiraceae bacterium]
MMKLDRNIEIIEYKNKVILANKLTGVWLRLSKEVYKYIEEAIKNNYTKERFIYSFSRKEDQKYIDALLERMDELGILGNSEIFLPKSIAFEITNRCNLKCAHCCFRAGNERKDFSTQKIVEIMQKIIQWHPDKITITGGEPLYRNDIFELLNFLRDSYTGKIILASNGVLINSNNVDKIIRCVDCIDISIDGVDESSCARIRGEGVFKKVINSVQLLKKKGFHAISLSMVLTKENELLEEQFIRLNHKLGTIPVMRRMSWLGRALENREILASSDILYEHGAEIDRSDKGMCTYGNCQNLKTKYHIRYDGYVYACQTIENKRYSIGHVDQISSFNTITDNKLALLTDDLLKSNHKCRQCPVMKFCWKCPVEIMEYTNNGSMEEHCKTVSDNLFRVIWEE